MEDKPGVADDNDVPQVWSEELRPQLRRALDERRRRQTLGGQIFAGALVVVVGSGVVFRLDPGLWVPTVGVVALAALVFRLTNWKCPACGEGLPARRSRNVCLGCGLPLE